METLDEKIARIYKQKVLQTLVADYVETDNNEVKAELYEKIKVLIAQLGFFL